MAAVARLMPEGVLSWAGYVVAALTIIVTWFQSKRKGDIDESALILGKWKELVEQHQSDIRGIREEFTAYKTSALEEISALRTRVREAEDRSLALEKRVSELETENAGLKRAIAQNSRSAAVILGRSPFAEEVDKLDQAGDNSKGRKL